MSEKQVTCGCGCGETFTVPLSSRRQYLNATHVMRGQRAREGGRLGLETKVCACGCGQTFTGIKSKKYFDDKHGQRARRGPSVSTLEAVERGRALEISRLSTINSRLARENDELRKLLDRYSTIKPADQKVPHWLKPKRKLKDHRATPVLLLSDLHLDEVVDLQEMDGINEYNREIAVARYERVINGTVDLLSHYVSGVHYDGIVAAMLGDVITGDIHVELSRTNEAPVPASIVYWVPRLASGLVHLADTFGRVYVPCVDGNHDRTYIKTPKKKRAESSFAWIIYNWLADTLRDDSRITFGISTSPEQLIDVYDTTLLLSHGDGFRSAGGVGGLYPSMLKWLLRKHQLYSAQKRDFDYATIGHWHQDLYGPDFVVNASLKGYDEYAKDGGFTYGIAAQQLFTITPERGMVQRLTVHAD